MAKIRNWREVSSEQLGREITEVEATWSIQAGTDNRRLLVIRTYGSDARQDTGTPSQVVHLDKAGAAELLAILMTSLPSLD